MSIKMTGGKKWSHTFNANRVQMTIHENMEGTTDAMRKAALYQYMPRGTRTKKPGQKRLAQTIRRTPNAKNGYMFSSGDYTDTKKYKGSFKGGYKSRYKYNGSFVPQNKNKYEWFDRSYRKYRHAMTVGLSPCHKTKNGRVVK